MNNRHLIALFTMLVSIMFIPAQIPVPAQSATTTYPWPMFHHDSARTGSTESPAPAPFVVEWKYATNGYVSSSPAVVDGRVYVGSSDYRVYCLDVNGTLVWRHATEGPVSSSPAIVDGRVYVGSDDHDVYCFDVNGTLLWKYTTGGPVSSSPAVVDKKVYVGSNDFSIYCLDINGTLVWKYATLGSVSSSPAVTGGKVYVGSDDYGVYCLDVNGTLVWRHATEGPVSSSPAIVDGKVYIGSDDQNVYCLNMNGTLAWKYIIPPTFVRGPVRSTPAIVNGKVYVGYNKNPLCLNATTGESVWISSTSFVIYSSPAVAAGKVYIGSDDHNLYCYDAESGNKLHSYLSTANFRSSAAVVDGNVYIGGWDTFVYCFVAGVPKVSTTISCVVSDPSVTLGDSLTVSGSISPVVSGVQVTLTYTKPGGTVLNRTVTSKADGSFNDTYTPDVEGSWHVKSGWSGDTVHESATSSSVTFTVTAAQPIATTINCAVSVISVTLGDSSIVSGSISPAVSGAQVILAYTKPDGTIVNRTVTAGADGSFNDTYTPNIEGNWSVKAVFSGDAGHVGSTSTSATFTVVKASSDVGGVPMEYVYAIVAIISIAVVAVAAYLYMKRGKK